MCGTDTDLPARLCYTRLKPSMTAIVDFMHKTLFFLEMLLKSVALHPECLLYCMCGWPHVSIQVPSLFRCLQGPRGPLGMWYGIKTDITLYPGNLPGVSHMLQLWGLSASNNQSHIHEMLALLQCRVRSGIKQKVLKQKV